MTARPLEVLLHHLPGVIYQAETDWERRFAMSILRKARRRTWTPSRKEQEIMEGLVAHLFNEYPDQAVAE